MIHSQRVYANSQPQKATELCCSHLDRTLTLWALKQVWMDRVLGLEIPWGSLLHFPYYQQKYHDSIQVRAQALEG